MADELGASPTLLVPGVVAMQNIGSERMLNASTVQKVNMSKNT